jgi:outer membrane protein assembly factor BamB
MTPVIYQDMAYCSAAYGIGAAVCKITKTGGHYEATQLWFEPANVLNNHWSTPVCQDGYLYGLFGQKEFGRGPLKCVEMATGKIMWSKEGFGPGGCTLVNGHVLVLSDSGDLILVKTDKAAYSETARFHALAGKCWSTPSISDGRIYARSTEQGGCFNAR